MNPEDIRRFYAYAVAKQMIERQLNSVAKELGGCADGFGSFGNPEGE